MGSRARLLGFDAWLSCALKQGLLERAQVFDRNSAPFGEPRAHGALTRERKQGGREMATVPAEVRPGFAWHTRQRGARAGFREATQ